jgi:hypothetical protein
MLHKNVSSCIPYCRSQRFRTDECVNFPGTLEHLTKHKEYFNNALKEGRLSDKSLSFQASQVGYFFLFEYLFRVRQSLEAS